MEVVVARREAANADGRTTHATKRLRVNGVPHRAVTVIGQVLSVFFTSLDIDLITGPPAGRRRYLDITLSQTDHAYLRALQRYNRVVQQRNSLLRQIEEGHAGADQLAPWDEELIAQGSLIVAARAAATAELSASAGEIQRRLSQGREHLAVRYQPRLGGDGPGGIPPDREAIARELREALGRRRRREIAAGVSLVGPHRDDLLFELDGAPAATFGSRAQQRTVALALRLAEAGFLQQRSGEAPILLLDDILSELDERRRVAVLDTVADVEQALITTADLDRFSGSFLTKATIYSVNGGQIEPLS